MVVPTEWSRRCGSRKYDWESAEYLSAMQKMPFALTQFLCSYHKHAQLLDGVPPP